METKSGEKMFAVVTSIRTAFPSLPAVVPWISTRGSVCSFVADGTGIASAIAGGVRLAGWLGLVGVASLSVACFNSDLINSNSCAVTLYCCRA